MSKMDTSYRSSTSLYPKKIGHDLFKHQFLFQISSITTFQKNFEEFWRPIRRRGSLEGPGVLRRSHVNCVNEFNKIFTKIQVFSQSPLYHRFLQTLGKALVADVLIESEKCEMRICNLEIFSPIYRYKNHSSATLCPNGFFAK